MIRIRHEYRYEDHPEFGFVAKIPVWVKYRASIRKTLFGHRRVVWTEVQQAETYSKLLSEKPRTVVTDFLQWLKAYKPLDYDRLLAEYTRYLKDTSL